MINGSSLEPYARSAEVAVLAGRPFGAVFGGRKVNAAVFSLLASSKFCHLYA